MKSKITIVDNFKNYLKYIRHFYTLENLGNKFKVSEKINFNLPLTLIDINIYIFFEDKEERKLWWKSVTKNSG